MIKVKLIADIFLSAAWVVVIALGAVLRDWTLVAISAVAALLFLCFVWYDAIKIDSEQPKYVIAVGNGSYYDGHGWFACRSKAKIYRSFKSVQKAYIKIIEIHQISPAMLPTVQIIATNIENAFK